MIAKAFRPVKIGNRIIPPDSEFEASAEVIELLQQGGAGITVIKADDQEPAKAEEPKPKPKPQVKPRASKKKASPKE